ncbi:hypothetical protein MNBD_PLANCTO02-2410 [hydrothermal vent metagenome]|uniref:Uncharacterized protein n=1 Tax=hydrothermal vent metagenome TaxID=652676 RepID=A0A3B1DSY4_9ZZZZ
MPKKIINPINSSREEDEPICNALVKELKAPNESGQPLIEEKYIERTGVVHITVIWDRWEHIPKANRSAIIRSAYAQAEGKEFSQRIILAIGLTFPEAIEGELLPYAIQPLHRRDDKVTLEQCKQAMLKEGATRLGDTGIIALRFPTLEDAEKSKSRLGKSLPGSEDIWSISLNETVYQNLKLSDLCE